MEHHRQARPVAGIVPAAAPWHPFPHAPAAFPAPGRHIRSEEKAASMEAPRHSAPQQAALLQGALPHLMHGFFGLREATRHADGNDDGAAAAIARQAFGAGAPLELGQPHGPAIVSTIGGPITEPARLAADGALADGDFHGLIAIRSADCVPVLAADPETGRFAALHAGWRGTAAGILPALLRQLRGAGSSLRAVRLALGPGIGPCCFEVREDCIGAFEAGHLHGAVDERDGHTFLDLHRVLRNQADAAGITAGQMETLALCTRCAHDGTGQPLFASFRRSNQQGESNAPRNYSLIGILPSA